MSSIGKICTQCGAIIQKTSSDDEIGMCLCEWSY